MYVTLFVEIEISSKLQQYRQNQGTDKTKIRFGISELEYVGIR